MGFNLPGDLTAYTQENTELLSSAVLNTKELEHISIRTGVPAAKTAVNVFNGTITEQARDCNMSDLGDLNFDQIVIDVEDKAVAQDLCPTDLRAYWMSERMRPGAAGGEEVPFEAVIAEYVQKSVSKNISDFIGAELIAQITVALGSQNSGQTAASTVGTILDDLNDLYEALPAVSQLQDDVKIFMSPTFYRMALRAIVASGNGVGMYHYNIEDGTGKVFLPGTNAELVQSSGFIGSNRFVAFSAKQAIFATGLMDDSETIRMVYDEVNDKVALRAYYRRGLGVYDVATTAVNGSF